MTNRRLMICGMIALLLAGCHLPKPNPQADAVAHAAFDDIHHGADGPLSGILAPTLLTPDSQAKIADLRRYIPGHEPRTRSNVGWNETRLIGAGTMVSTTDQYDFGDHIVLAQTRLTQAAGSPVWKVDGVHIQSATPDQLSVNDFASASRTPWQWLFLVLVIASPVLMVCALVKVIRTPGLKRKWLWGILAFFGLLSLRMNWTTGHVAVNVLTLQFLGAGAVRADTAFAPWTLTMTLPVGAALILSGLWANPARAPKPRRPGALA
jgi:hypothetical protein